MTTMSKAWLGLAVACAITAAAPQALAQAPAEPLPSAIGTGDCDRACLTRIADALVAAQLAHDPSKAPLAKGARYSENGVELPMPDGFWKNASGAGAYRLYVADPEWGEVGFFSRMTENGANVVVSTRLKVFGRKITEIETIVGQENFGRGPLTPDLLGDTPRPAFLRIVSPAQRRTRDKLIRIVNTYFTGLENNVGDKPPLFAKDCDRLENGWHTTNVPLKPGEKRTNLNMGCAEDIAMGYHHNDTRLRNRRVIAIDVERQLVFTGVYFDHDNSPAVRGFKMKDGVVLELKKDTSPSTWGMHEVFQIAPDGISQVEAVIAGVPYGMRPYFSTGVHLDSEQAVKDGFQEY